MSAELFGVWLLGTLMQVGAICCIGYATNVRLQQRVAQRVCRWRGHRWTPWGCERCEAMHPERAPVPAVD